MAAWRIVGWARQPVLDCNLENAGFYRLRFLQPLRIKRWDYYGLTTATHFYSFTLSDLGYLQMVFAYVVDFAQPSHHEETLTLLPGAGVRLPRNSAEGESRFDNGKVRLIFRANRAPPAGSGLAGFRRAGTARRGAPGDASGA